MSGGMDAPRSWECSTAEQLRSAKRIASRLSRDNAQLRRRIDELERQGLTLQVRADDLEERNSLLREAAKELRMRIRDGVMKRPAPRLEVCDA